MERSLDENLFQLIMVTVAKVDENFYNTFTSSNLGQTFFSSVIPFLTHFSSWPFRWYTFEIKIQFRLGFRDVYLNEWWRIICK